MSTHIKTPRRSFNPPKRLMVPWFEPPRLGGRGAPPPGLGTDHDDVGGGEHDDD